MSSLLNNVKNLVHSPTEIKVRQATNENENFGATGTLMNEISVLTYSPRTLKEIIPIVRKRLLLGCNKKSVSHKNCIMLVKTLTLVSYLLNNGSNDFIRWSMSNIDIFQTLRRLPQSAVDLETDGRLYAQIIGLARDITQLVQNPELLEQRRHDVVQFRSSISSPGRKSTDNSHLLAAANLYRATNGMDTYNNENYNSSSIRNKSTGNDQGYSQQHKLNSRNKSTDLGGNVLRNNNAFATNNSGGNSNNFTAVRSTRSLDLRRNLPYMTAPTTFGTVGHANKDGIEVFRHQPPMSVGGTIVYHSLAPLREEEVATPLPVGTSTTTNVDGNHAPSGFENASGIGNTSDSVRRRFKPTNPFA